MATLCPTADSQGAYIGPVSIRCNPLTDDKISSYDDILFYVIGSWSSKCALKHFLEQQWCLDFAEVVLPPPVKGTGNGLDQAMVAKAARKAS